MNWKDIWMTLFGTADLFGLNMGFWAVSYTHLTLPTT